MLQKLLNFIIKNNSVAIDIGIRLKVKSFESFNNNSDILVSDSSTRYVHSPSFGTLNFYVKINKLWKHIKSKSFHFDEADHSHRTWSTKTWKNVIFAPIPDGG